MATPSIQTLITQAQQVLNLQSSNEIRATLAAVLANANVGTPLNPNLTTQQLWNEFGEIVRQSTDDIMSIITDQMMRMVFSPPAPGGAGADKQVIFNDGGVLAGDAGLVYNKTTDTLTAGNATITGDLTVDTSTLKVDSTNDRVGIGTATPAATLNVKGGVRVDADYNAIYAYKDDGTLIGYTLFRDNGPNYFNVNSNQPLYLSTNNVAQVQVETSGDVKINTGNVVMGTANKGIDFAINSEAAGRTSELLNDYEEGTWTPALSTDDVPFTSVTYVQQDGHYTKVGRLVTFCGTIYTSGVVKGAANGVVTITGLPFQQVAGLNSVLCYAAAFWASDSPVSGVVDNYRILLLKRPTTLGVATGTQTLTVAEVATGGTSNFLRFSGQYYV